MNLNVVSVVMENTKVSNNPETMVIISIDPWVLEK
jgi:hypothetical protein